MPITLNGTTGIDAPLGTAAVPSYGNTTNTNTGLYYPTATTLGLSTNGTAALTIDASQNVGIGTASPANKLHVVGPQGAVASFPTLLNQTFTILENNFHARVAGVVPTSAAYEFGTYAYGSGDTNPRAGISMVPQGSYILFSTGSGSTAISERMRIDSSGNVGVGTSSPGVKLDVAGQRFRIGSVASDPGIEISNGVNTKGYLFYDTTNDLVVVRHASTGTGVAINSSGNVGIGNTNPSWPLDFSTSLNGTLLRGGSSSAISLGNYNGEGNIASGQTLADTGIWTARNTAASIITLNASASGVITFSTNSGLTVGNTFNPTERMRIDNLGNVGIGTGSNLTLNKTTILGNAGLIVSPDADNSNNGMGVGITGASIATTTGGSAKLYMSGGNSAHSGNLALRAGTVVDTTINMYNTSGTRTVLVAAGGSSYFNGGNVGIGTSSPSYALHVTGTGSYGGQLLVATTTSNFNNGINLAAAGAGYITGTNGDAASSTVANIKIASWFGLGFSSAITGQSVPYGENAGWINCRDGAMSIRGTLTQNASDRRLKENLEVIPNALDKINQINGYTFDWKMQECFNLGFKPAQEHEHGVIAQEIQAVVPDAVVIAPFDNECGEDGVHYSKSGEQYLTVKIEKIIPLLLQGIKELNAIVKTQAAEISQLKGVS